jgi:hypothetical protein
MTNDDGSLISRRTLSATLTPSTAAGGAEGERCTLARTRSRQRRAPRRPGAESALPQEIGRWSASLSSHTRQGRYLDTFLNHIDGVATAALQPETRTIPLDPATSRKHWSYCSARVPAGFRRRPSDGLVGRACTLEQARSLSPSVTLGSQQSSSQARL